MNKVSVITINLNNLEGLKKTMQSVFDQTFQDIEYIVIDGGSEDGSKEWIELQSHKLVYWISERDTGIYNAMNKAVCKAGGEYIFFLNSGDLLISNEIFQTLNIASFNKDIIYGNIQIQGEVEKWIKTYPEFLTFDYFTYDTLPHSGGAFIKKNLFQIVGKYNERFRILADWEFYMKALFWYNCSYTYINKTISIFDANGFSSVIKNRELFKKELNIILTENFKTLFEINTEFKKIKHKYELLKSSRIVKAYLNIKRIL